MIFLKVIRLINLVFVLILMLLRVFIKRFRFCLYVFVDVVIFRFSFVRLVRFLVWAFRSEYYCCGIYRLGSGFVLSGLGFYDIMKRKFKFRFGKELGCFFLLVILSRLLIISYSLGLVGGYFFRFFLGLGE